MKLPKKSLQQKFEDNMTMNVVITFQESESTYEQHILVHTKYAKL